MTRRRVWIVTLLSSLMLLAACSSEEGNTPSAPGGGYHIEVGAADTQVAQTATALAIPSATPGPSPTASLTPTPYAMPTAGPEVDPSTVITRVGSDEITLGEFQERVRFERWFRLYQLDKLVRKQGFSVLDLRNPANEFVASTFVTLADSKSFGKQTQRVMVIESIVTQEANRRGMEVDPFQFDRKAAEYMLLTVDQNTGQLPPEYEAEYARFVEQMKTYTGMSEEEFRRVVRAQTLYDQVKFLMYQDPEATGGQEAQAGMEVQDILVETPEQAAEVVERLNAGEAMADIAQSLGKTPAEGAGDSRIVRRFDDTLPQEVIDALFNAEAGAVVGPFQVGIGWYVALVKGEKFEALSPSELDAVREDYFLGWIEGRMDDPDLVVDYDNWFDYIPEDPLPQDVSPLLHDENVILPEGADDLLDLSATATEEAPDVPTGEPAPVTEEANTGSIQLIGWHTQDATPTPTPYAIPTNAPDVDGAMVITRVGDEEITLDAFQKRVRFERWFRLYQLALLVEKYGPGHILDLRDPNNAFVLDLFSTLADTTVFGRQVQRIMVVEAIIRQEADARHLELDPARFDAKLMGYLILQPGENGAPPSEFDERYADFLAEMGAYTGMTEADFREVVRSQTLYYQLQFEIGQDPAAVPSSQGARTGFYVQDILVSSESEALEVVRRLQAGEDMLDIAESLGYSSTTGQANRLLTFDDESLPPVIRDALFAAQPGDILGPIELEQGWYVAAVGDEVLDVLTPKQIEDLRLNFFLDWVERHMDDPSYVEDYGNWEPYIPQEPIPLDVSPYLSENYIIMPEPGTYPGLFTPTPRASTG